VTVLSESAKPLPGVQFDAAVSAALSRALKQSVRNCPWFDLRTHDLCPWVSGQRTPLQRDIDDKLYRHSDLPPQR